MLKKPKYYKKLTANGFVTVVVYKRNVPLSAYFVHVSNRVLELAVVVVAVKVKLAYSPAPCTLQFSKLW